jgi:chromosome partitioning protein
VTLLSRKGHHRGGVRSSLLRSPAQVAAESARARGISAPSATGERAAPRPLVRRGGGPNLGAINRAALIAADRVLMPLAADLFSLKGLSDLGPALRDWRRDWQQLVLPRVPGGFLRAACGDASSRLCDHAAGVRLDRPVKAYERWPQRIPWAYWAAVLGAGAPVADDDRHRIATLRNYRSLMPLAHDARKPISA